ncbi:MAG: deoxynucleoside kinase [Cytophagales bacterium]|nr:deoxynucleoside kinase [Cytophagales bacterium]
MHIAIAGNIGAGKTTLADKLAAHYGWEMLPELPEENPYLADFYEDMPRWAFQVQIHFLATRFEQILTIGRSDKTYVQDRTIYEDAYVFARNLHTSGLLDIHDYNTYLRLFNNMMQLVRPPGLLIYLDAGLPKLTLQVKKRGKVYEANVEPAYLAALQVHYREWIADYRESPLLHITNGMDFVARTADLGKIIAQVDAKLAELRLDDKLGC